MNEDKELERLRRLHEEYEKQKLRIVKIMEINCKVIGVKKVAKNLRVNYSYLYRVFDGLAISYDKIRELYCDIIELKKILGIGG